jgi:beta-lactamase class A
MQPNDPSIYRKNMNYTPLNHTPMHFTPMNYTPLRIRPVNNQKGANLLTFILLFFLISVTASSVYLTVNKTVNANTNNFKVISAIPTFTPTPKIETYAINNTPAVIPTQGPILQNVVEDSLTDSKATYGVVIKNLKTGEMYTMNEHRVFQSASLYKLWVMIETYNQMANGKLKEDDVLSRSIPSLNSEFGIASTEAELNDGGITLTVKDALTQMITVSSNYAAYLLTDKVGYKNVKTFLENRNFTDSSISSPPKTSAHDIATLLEELYNREVADTTYTTKMLDLLKAQQVNRKLPKYMDQDIVIAHKTGELNEFSHDAGIVYEKNGDYIIVVLTESNNVKDAEEHISQLARNVEKYFENKN